MYVYVYAHIRAYCILAIPIVFQNRPWQLKYTRTHTHTHNCAPFNACLYVLRLHQQLLYILVDLHFKFRHTHTQPHIHIHVFAAHAALLATLRQYGEYYQRTLYAMIRY